MRYNQKRGYLFLAVWCWIAVMICILFMCTKVEAGILTHEIDTVKEACGQSLIEHPSPLKHFNIEGIKADICKIITKNNNKYLIKRLTQFVKMTKRTNPESEWANINPKQYVNGLGLKAEYTDRLLMIYDFPVFNLMEVDGNKVVYGKRCLSSLIRQYFDTVIVVPIDPDADPQVIIIR